jgi:hypothetical protein
MEPPASVAASHAETPLGVGTRLRKAFGREVFDGEVVAHHSAEGEALAEELFEVLYDDGDREDLTRAELVAVLAKPPPETKKRGRNATTTARLTGGQAPRRTQPRRVEKLAPLPTALKRIFFEPHTREKPGLSCRGRAVRLLHSNPNVFEIEDFITESEWRHLDAIVTQQVGDDGEHGRAFPRARETYSKGDCVNAFF